MIRVILKPEKDKPLRGFHPWVFSGAIDQIDDGFKAGDLVKVYSNREEFLGIGYLNPRSQIAVRMLTFREEVIDEEFFAKRLREAKALRDAFLPAQTNACRLIHSEGDFLPGLIVDRYADYLVVQFSTAGMDALKPIVLNAIRHVFEARGIYEHEDPEMRNLEGLPADEDEKTGGTFLRTLCGEAPPDFVEIEEYSHRFIVDIKHGQKTGFFLDQRENRRKLGQISNGKRVLNCFAYTGGFSIYAAKGGALSVTSVEAQERALNMIKTNFELNDLPSPSPLPQGEGKGEGRYRFIKADVFDFLRSDREIYDLIILDPPAFCRNKNQIQHAARGYKDINLYALRHLSAGGILFTSSCSSYIDPDLFQKIIFGAAKDAQRHVQIIEKTSHSFDHPINVFHPEGEYLKGIWLRAV